MQEVWKPDSVLDKNYPTFQRGLKFIRGRNRKFYLYWQVEVGQPMEWFARHMYAGFNYPSSVDKTNILRREWCDSLYDTNQPYKPYITAFQLNLPVDKNADFVAYRFGAQLESIN
ncbi:hypothetical protein PZB74_02490 [Porifericola rhodea]|uniref:hypothetical protein n=1 Tax=Porifericola rhodea TaxID=930972 RepID=UPI0026670D0B|nr:hypothetical protein [Porifericola rhodea]WKN32223.1 hypothetical protein PZB74_02490 [Porifericola rhodea]